MAFVPLGGTYLAVPRVAPVFGGTYLSAHRPLFAAHLGVRGGAFL
jgi:hypothetical protein